ncbi:MAG: hypothetical protein DRI56_00940 [Chloroflexota bacterium]|nr:MAG: hypothetical protein DRI56_00940 [Chloroflexota bacterium]
MRRGRVALYLILIVILLGAGGVVAYQRYFSGGKSDSANQPVATPVTVNVVVITQKTPLGTVLDETVLGTIPIAQDLFIEGMFSDIAEVVGYQARFDLDSGIPLTVNMLADSATQLSARGSLASLSIPKGMVAMTIPINRLSSVAYALKPGDDVMVMASMEFVDIDSEFQTIFPNTILPNASMLTYAPTSILGMGGEGEDAALAVAFLDLWKELLLEQKSVTGGRVDDANADEAFYTTPSEAQRSRLAVQIIIPRAQVLHVGEFPWAEVEEVPGVEATPTTIPAEAQLVGSNETGAIEPEKPEAPDLITLIVTSQEAINLTYLLNSGVDLTLALRSAGDDTVLDTQTVTMQYFLDSYSIPVPAKLPYGFAPRLDEVELPTEKQPTPTPQQ